MLAASDDTEAGLVLAARLEDCGTVDVGATFPRFDDIFCGTVDVGAILDGFGFIFCGVGATLDGFGFIFGSTVDVGATFGNILLLILDVIRSWTFRSIRSSRATASFVRI